MLAETLYFTIKEGKEHEGIKNCFIKFQDGTYVEFTTPVDSAQATGIYYTEFLLPGVVPDYAPVSAGLSPV